MKHLFALLLFLPVLAPAQDNLNAILWQQTAAESRRRRSGLSRRRRVARALADPHWTAAR